MPITQGPTYFDGTPVMEGDIIAGIPKSDEVYGITNSQSTLEVKGFISERGTVLIRVKTLTSTAEPRAVGMMWELDPSLFSLLKRQDAT